jgi:hypothetical protein
LFQRVSYLSNIFARSTIRPSFFSSASANQVAYYSGCRQRPSPPLPYILLFLYSQITVVRTKIMRYTYLHRLMPISCLAIEACDVLYNRRKKLFESVSMVFRFHNRECCALILTGCYTSYAVYIHFILCSLSYLRDALAETPSPQNIILLPVHHFIGCMPAVYTSGMMSFAVTYLCTSISAAGTDHRTFLGTISYEGVEIPTIWTTWELIRAMDILAMKYGRLFSIRLQIPFYRG